MYIDPNTYTREAGEERDCLIVKSKFKPRLLLQRLDTSWLRKTKVALWTHVVNIH